MKCPNCNFVTSNTNDLCTRCGMDLRPRKRELGITITNPAADIKALRARLAAQPAKPEDSNGASDRPGQEKSKETPREKSWLSRIFGKTAVAAPSSIPAETQQKPQLQVQPGAAAPSGPNLKSQIKPEPQTAAAPAAAKPAVKTAAAPGQPQAIEMELSLADLAIPQSIPDSHLEGNGTSGAPVEIIGDDIQPDLSLNDFLSELERFQAVASDDDAVEPEHPMAMAEDGGEEGEAIDAELELPVFDLDDDHDLLSDSLFGGSTGSLPPPAALSAVAPVETAESSSEGGLELFPAAAAPTEIPAGQLSVEAAHELAYDNLIGSMIAPKTDSGAEDEESDDDALFSSLLESDSGHGEKLAEMAQSLEDNLEDAMSATSELAEGSIFGEPDGGDEEDLRDELFPAGEDGEELDSDDDSESEQTEPEEDPPVPMESASPDVTPDVMEFDDDDKILEQQLDEMLGDLVLNVTPVKKAKPAAAEIDDDDDGSVFIDDDIEISFDIEDDDEEEIDDTAAVKSVKSKTAAAKDSGRSDQILDQLVEAFNQIDSGTVHHSIADTPDEPAPAATPIKIDTMLLRLRAAAQFGSPNLIDELLEQLAQGYGVDSDMLREAVAPSPQTPDQEAEVELKSPISKPAAVQTPAVLRPPVQPADSAISGESDFSDLSSVLDLELAALMSEGTSIFGEAVFAESVAPEELPAEIPAAVELQAEEPAIDAELMALQDSLDSELALLAAEGTTLIHEPVVAPAAGDSIVAAESPAETVEPEPFAPTQTGAFLISDLTSLAGEGPAVEEFEPELGPELEPELEIADLEAELAHELAGLQQDGVSLYSLPESAGPETAVAAESEEPAPFTPTQTGAFLISDLTALVSESSAADQAQPEPEIADLEAELANELAGLQQDGVLLYSVPEPASIEAEAIAADSAEAEPAILDPEVSANDDISDLAAELDQELALLEAEGLSPVRAESAAAAEPADSIEPAEAIGLDEAIEAGISGTKETDELVELGDLEEFDEPALLMAEAAVLSGSGEIEAQLEEVQLDEGLLDEVSLDDLEDKIDEIDDDGDEPDQLNGGGTPALESEIESSATATGVFLASDLETILNSYNKQAGEKIAEPATPPDELVSGSDPGDSSGQTPVPFDPEEVSIEPAEESAVNFSQSENNEITAPVLAAPADTAAAAEREAAPVAPIRSVPSPVRVVADISAELWEAALAEAGIDQADFEIDAAEMCDSGPNPKLTLLFDLADEELESPEKKVAYVHAAPTSVSRALIDAGLKRAVKRYETEIHKEITRKPADDDSGTQPNVSVDELLKILSPAPLWRRCGSLLFDLLASTSVAAAVVWFTLADDTLRDHLLNLEVPAPADALPAIVAVAGISWILWTIFNVLPTSESGQTTGQKLFGIAVFDLEGNTPGFVQVFTRTMLELTTVMTFGLGILPGLGRRKQMLHDKLARTVVIRLGE